MKLSDIDKNFAVSKIDIDKYNFYSYKELELEGFPWFSEDDELLRLPKRLFNKFSEPLVEMAYSCAGGVVRLATNSKKLAVKCKLRKMRHSSGMPLASDAGIDVYCGLRFIANCRPEVGDDFIDMEIDTNLDETNTISLYLPIFSGIDVLEIGVLNGSIVDKPTPHKIQKPMCFYGSSVTNGGCATRPGLTYPAVITRMLDAPMINLGFSGNAKGEAEIAEEIAKLDLSAVMMEYDHNSPDTTHLQETHEPFFQIIRNAHKDIPFVLMTGWFFRDFDLENRAKRKDIIYKTYSNAVQSGDKNVYFIDGSSIYPQDTKTDYSVDVIHPNDMGFNVIANKVLEFYKKYF